MRSVHNQHGNEALWHRLMVVAGVLGGVTGYGQVARAASTTNATWTGGGGASTNWNTLANWASSLQPSGAGATIVHFAGSTSLTPSNDYNNTQFNQILFDSGASSFNLVGKHIKLKANGSSKGVIANNSSVLQTVGFSIPSGSPLLTNPPANYGILAESNIELDPISGDLVVNSNIISDNNAVAGTPNTIGVFGSFTMTYNGSISEDAGHGGTAKLSVGFGTQNPTAILSGSNTYTGGTTIISGSLYVNNTAGSGTGSGAVVVNTPSNLASATLGGTGTISGSVDIKSGAVITGGTKTSIGKLTTGSETWESGGKYSVQTDGTTNDKLVMTDLNPLTGGPFTIELSGVAGPATLGRSIVIATDTNVSGGVDPFAAAIQAGYLALSISGTSPVTADTPGYTLWLTSVPNGNGYDLVVVPEPASLTMLACGAAPFVLGRRRRRSGSSGVGLG